MTCIAGIAKDGNVFIGADSAGVSGWDLTVRADQKVFRTGPFVMGFTTSFRMGQLLRYRLNVSERRPSESIEAYMVITFIDTVRQCLTDGGWKTIKDGADQGGQFLVGYQGRLFAVHSDFQVAESVDGLAAVGCGDSYALGAMEATPELEPTERIRNALAIAERRSAGVRGPFAVETLAKQEAG